MLAELVHHVIGVDPIATGSTSVATSVSPSVVSPAIRTAFSKPNRS
jgi:hypothetical protein